MISLKRLSTITLRILLVCILVVLVVRMVSLVSSRLKLRPSYKDVKEILLVDSPSGGKPDISLLSIHPATSDLCFPYLDDVVRSLNIRLNDILTVSRARGHDFRYVFQGGYGSGFLRLNTVGNDLDYSLKIHLGELDVTGRDSEAAADALLKRIEEFLNSYLDVMIHDRGPELVPTWFSYMRKGRLRSRKFHRKHLAESFKSLWKDRVHYMMFESRSGTIVPSSVPAGTLTLWTHLMPSSHSNQIRYTEDMFPGIREISVGLSFYVDLADKGRSSGWRSRREVPVMCLHPYSGRMIGLDRYFIFIAPGGERSREYVETQVRKDPELFTSYRISVGGDLVEQVEVQLAMGLPLKALKRLHQALDYLKPIFDDSFVAEIEEFLERRMNDPDVLLSEETRVLASQAAAVLSNRTSMDVYLASGDLALVMERISENLAKLDARSSALPSVGSSGNRFALMGKKLKYGWLYGNNPRRSIRDILMEIVDETEARTIACLADAEEETRSWRRRIVSELGACGVRPVPVYGLSSDGILGVLAEDIEGIATIDDLNRLASADDDCFWRYRLIERGEIPPDKDGSTSYSPSLQWLRPSPSEIEEARYREVRAALTADLHWFEQGGVSEAANQ
ncbi:MAG: hypothetical protein JW814_08600 [Candidatus Krumholzibacteriota bacterium]|nr:hypothetical protein [Candidatus Krumholzibacteriota bacterium]